MSEPTDMPASPTPRYDAAKKPLHEFETTHQRLIRALAALEAAEIESAARLGVIAGLQENLDLVRDAVDARDKKIEQLEAWKEPASQVMNQIDLQAVGKELDVPLGEGIAPHILPGIQKMKDGLREQAARIEELETWKARLSEDLRAADDLWKLERSEVTKLREGLDEANKDVDRINLLENSAMRGLKWVARWSTTGRGFRLHQDQNGRHETAREALDAMALAGKEGA